MAKKKSKFYAIKYSIDSNGDSIENLILQSWSECEPLVKGKNANYKSFSTMEEAQSYLNTKSLMLIKGVDTYPDDCFHLYVDGSYNTTTDKYSYAFIAVKNNIIHHIQYADSKNTALKDLRQIVGELEAAVKSVGYVKNENENQMVILFDYKGVCCHATGEWERTERLSQRYYEVMNKFMNEGMNIAFVKVDGHTGDIYNEITDSFAKLAIDVNLTTAVNKWFRQGNTLYVLNEKIKDKISTIIKKDFLENVIVK